MPKNNAEWWLNKLEMNRARDLRKDQELLDLGWTPLHFWEHEGVSSAADQIEAYWMQIVGR